MSKKRKKIWVPERLQYLGRGASLMNKLGYSQLSLGPGWTESFLKSVGTSHLSCPVSKCRQILNSLGRVGLNVTQDQEILCTRGL